MQYLAKRIGRARHKSETETSIVELKKLIPESRKLTFGKYKGHQLYYVVLFTGILRGGKRYIDWCEKNISWFNLSEEERQDVNFLAKICDMLHGYGIRLGGYEDSPEYKESIKTRANHDYYRIYCDRIESYRREAEANEDFGRPEDW